MTTFDRLTAREPLSKKVASEIEEAVRLRKLVPGTRLPSEQELGTQFGVSRTVIREAVRMLSAKGLLSIAKGKGIFVRPFDADNVADPMHLYLQLQIDRDYALDVVHARQIIEPPIAAEAALKRTDQDIARLRAGVEELRGCPEGFEKLAALDMAFHLQIAKASHNPLLPLLLDPIHRLMPDIKSSVYKTVKDARDSAVVWHSKILEKILQRDPDGAREAMQEHLMIAQKHTMKMLRAQKIISPTEDQPRP